MGFRFLIALLFLSLISGCYTHTASLAPNTSAPDWLPKKFLMAGVDKKTGYVLVRDRNQFRMDDATRSPVKIRPLPGAGGAFLAETASTKDGKTSYTTVLFKRNSSRDWVQVMDTKGVKTRRELEAAALAAIRENNPKKNIGFTMYNLSNSRDIAKARAWLAAAQAAKAKPGTKPKTEKKPAKAVKRAGQYVYTEEKDVMTGKLKQFVFAFSDPANIGKPPFVRLGCYDRSERYTRGLTVEWGQSLYDSFNGSGGEPVARITTKFGNDKPVELGWSMSGRRNQTYAPSAGLKLGGGLTTGILGSFAPGAVNAQLKFNWDNTLIHSAFWRQPSLAMRGYAMSGQEITMVFDTAEFRKVAANFRSHCRY